MLNTTLFCHYENGRYKTEYKGFSDGLVECFHESIPEVWEYFEELQERTKGRIYNLLICNK